MANSRIGMNATCWAIRNKYDPVDEASYRLWREMASSPVERRDYKRQGCQSTCRTPYRSSSIMQPSQIIDKYPRRPAGVCMLISLITSCSMYARDQRRSWRLGRAKGRIMDRMHRPIAVLRVKAARRLSAREESWLILTASSSCHETLPCSI